MRYSQYIKDESEFMRLRELKYNEKLVIIQLLMKKEI